MSTSSRSHALPACETLRCLNARLYMPQRTCVGLPRRLLARKTDFSLAKPTSRHSCISVDFESITCAACLRNAALPQCASAYATTYMRWITGHLRERKTTFSYNKERLTISSSERNLRLPCTSLSGTAICVWAHRFCDITN